MADWILVATQLTMQTQHNAVLNSIFTVAQWGSFTNFAVSANSCQQILTQFI